MRRSTVHRLAAIGALALALLPLPSLAQIRINGGNPVLALTTGLAGGDLIPAVNTTCLLRWDRQDVLTKITVSSSCPGQRFTLKVAAINVAHGTPAPEVTLTSALSGADFITAIPTGHPQKKNATLQYTASATFAQGNSDEVGVDQYQVTYTIVAQ